MPAEMTVRQFVHRLRRVVSGEWVRAFVAVGFAAGVVAAPASADPGDILFSDNFSGSLSQWSISASGGDASITGQTGASGNSLALRWGVVTAQSQGIDASAAGGLQLSAWIRRGDSSFSERPDAGEDLVFEYRDSGNAWHSIVTYAGSGTSAEILTLDVALPNAALHGNLSVRMRMTGGGGYDLDYWHVDNVAVTETAAAGGSFDLGTCEDFESGIGSWTISASGGSAGVSSHTWQSASNSLYTRGGVVSVTSPVSDLSTAFGVELSLWVRRGDDGFSGRPESGEDFVVEYLDDSLNWVQLASLPGGGTAGEVFDLSYALPSQAQHSGFRVRVRQTAGTTPTGDYWHADDVCLSGAEGVLYSFEEASWSGSAGEVEEANGLGLDGTSYGGASIGTANPAASGNPGTCNYGVFDGNYDYIEIADNAAFDISGELTVAAWIYMHTVPSELHTIVSKDTNYEYHIDSGGRVYWWWNDSTGNTRSFTTSSSISLNQWTHVAITYASGSQVIYVNGVAEATQTYTGNLANNNLPLYIGTDYDFISRAFDGFIDEVFISSQSFSQGEVVALRDATHPCNNSAAEFSINHDNFGIHCVAENIVVNVIDSAAGTPRLDYNATVELNTQTGNGTWQLIAGSGTLTDTLADDGVASYAWPLGESQATFALSYTQGTPSMDIDVYQTSDPGIRDNDAEGVLSFSPSGFMVTAAALSNPPPGVIASFAGAQTAAVPYNLYVAAYGQTPTDAACGIIETYTGTKSIEFWSTYDNPSSGTRTVAIDSVAIATSEGAATPRNVTFTNGQAVVSANYKDVGRLSIALKDDTTTDPTQLPDGIRGATAAFVSRPAGFTVSDVRNAAGSLVNPQAADASGAVFVAAGAPFRATVTARDADGDATPNYGQESSPESVRLDVELVAPVGGSAPAVAAATGFAAFAGGTSTAVDLTWSEVGIMQLRAGVGDADYLGAGDVTGTLSERVGRFVPDHFTTALNTPSFATTCAAGSYSYIGEPFAYTLEPEITATARAVGGGATLNYTGSFFKMTTASLGARNYSAASGTLDTSGLPGSGDPAVSETGPGLARIRFAAGSGLAFDRASEVDPFDAEISLAIDVIDTDAVAASANPVTFGASGGIVFDNGAQFRYGRIRFVNAVGSELVDLPVGLFSEYYVDAATGFVRNTDDACTTGVTINFSGFTEGLGAGETCVLDAGSPGTSGAGCAVAAAPASQFDAPPNAGSFNVNLAAPGAGNTGSVTLDADVPDWLQFDWDAATPGDEDPSAQAAFGLFSGQPSRIYTRELY